MELPAPEGAIGLTIETGRRPEQINQALDFGLSTLTDSPIDQWTKKAVEEARSQSDEWFRTKNKLKGPGTGARYQQLEGIPVEGLIDSITRKLEDPATAEAEKQSLQDTLNLLQDKRLTKYHIQRHRYKNPDKFRARVEQELQKRLEHFGADSLDYKAAEDALILRQELILPRKIERPSVTATPTTPESAETSNTTETPATEDAPDDEGGSAGTEQQTEPGEVVGVLANRSEDFEKNARMLARILIAKEQQRGSLRNPFTWGRKFGLSNLEAYWEDRLTRQIYRQMEASDNPYLDIDLSGSKLKLGDLFRGDARNIKFIIEANRTDVRESAVAKINQIKATVESGRSNQRQTEKIVVAQGELKKVLVGELLSPIVNGQISTPDQIQQKIREFITNHQNDSNSEIRDAVRQIFGADTTRFGETATVFATDLKEMGEQIQAILSSQASERSFANEQIDKYAKIILANVKWSSSQEAYFGKIDNLIRGIERRRVLGLALNPLVVSAAVSLGLGATLKLPGKFATALAATGGGVVAGGVLAGLQRGENLRVDYARASMESALHMPVPDKAKRREKLAKFVVDRVKVGDLLSKVQESLNSGNQDEIIKAIAQINMRLDYGDKNGVDLISFEGRTRVEQNRIALMKAALEARQKLVDQGVLGVDDKINLAMYGPDGNGGLNAEFRNKQKDKEAAFEKYRKWQMLKAAGGGAIIGAIGAFLPSTTMQLLGEVAKYPAAQFVIEQGRMVLTKGGHLILEAGKAAAETVKIRLPSTSPFLEGIIKSAEQAKLSFFPNKKFSIETTKQLFNKPENIKINDRINLMVDPKITYPGTEGAFRSASFYDALGNKIEMPPVKLTPEGHLVFTGNPPSEVTHSLSGGEYDLRRITDPNIGFKEGLKRIISPDGGYTFTNPKGETFTQGDFLMNIHTDRSNLSITYGPLNTQINGTISLENGNPVLRFPEGKLNENISAEFWKNLRENYLPKAGFEVKTLPSGETVFTIATVPDSVELIPVQELSTTNTPGSSEPTGFNLDNLAVYPPEVLVRRNPLEVNTGTTTTGQVEQQRSTTNQTPFRTSSTSTVESQTSASRQVNTETESSDELPAELERTRQWVEQTDLGKARLRRKTNQQRLAFYQEISNKVKGIQSQIETLYSGPLPTLDTIGEYDKQPSTDILSAQLITAINGLRGLGLYADSRHQINNFIDVLGGAQYRDAHLVRGTTIHDIMLALEQVAPEVEAIRSNSLQEILQAVKNGSTAYLELKKGEIVSIFPGNRISRNSAGQLEVQVIHAAQGEIKIPLTELTKSHLSLTENPNQAKALIISKKPVT